MIRPLFFAFLLLASPAATAQPLFSDNFDTYTPGISPPSPWTGNGLVGNSVSRSSPNSLAISASTFPSKIPINTGASPAGSIDTYIYSPDFGSRSPAWGISVIHAGEPYGAAGIGNLYNWGGCIHDVSRSIWHHIVISYNIVNTSAGYVHIYLDDSPVSGCQTDGPISGYSSPDTVYIYGQITCVGCEPVMYVDDFKIYAGSTVPQSRPIGQIIGLRDRVPRLPAALRGAYRRIEPAAFIPDRGKIN